MYEIENYLDYEVVVGVNSNVFFVFQIVEYDLEFVVVGVWVVVYLERFVEGYIFDFDFIVDGKFFVVCYFGCD